MTRVKAWMRLMKRKWKQPKKVTFSHIDDFEEMDFDHRPFYKR